MSKKNIPAFRPIVLIEPEETAPGGGRLRYVLDTEVSGQTAMVAIGEESVLSLGTKREEIYDVDRLLLDITTARWLLDQLPGVIERAEQIEEILEHNKRVAAGKKPSSDEESAA
jgi:hypothetical protein